MKRVIATILCVTLLLAGITRFGRGDCGAACGRQASQACCCCCEKAPAGAQPSCCCSDPAPRVPEPAPAPADSAPKVPELACSDAEPVPVRATEESLAPSPRDASSRIVPQAPSRSRQVVLSVFRL